MRRHSFTTCTAAAITLGLIAGAIAAPERSPKASRPKPAQAGPVSFHRDVRPILQRRCQGCHQPATKGGNLIVTSYQALKAGGDHGSAFVAGKPDASPLVQMVVGPEPKMPKTGAPLTAEQVSTLRRWVAQGARDDTPTAVEDPIGPGRPPVYRAPPVLTAMAFSPDGRLLAVAAYREIILRTADGAEIVGRLVGKSQRIHSVVFSPDGKILAAVGGLPARLGEVQFWDVEKRELIKAIEISYDTCFGASFSPDGKVLGFGCADKTVRAITVPDGQQVLKFDNHTDWVFGTAFANDGKHLVSTSRDKAVKLIEIASGSFVDDVNYNVYAGYLCLARHPKDDKVLVAGVDGVPRYYSIFKAAARTMMREDFNLIRAFEKQPWEVHVVAFSPDGSLLAVGGLGDEVRVYKVENGERVAALTGHPGGVFTLAFHPDGQRLLTGGFDGQVRVFKLPEGQLASSFVPVPVVPRVARTR